MAQLPQVTQRTIEPSGQTPGFQTVDYNPADFGAGIGRALGELGQTLGEAARTERLLNQGRKGNEALDWSNKAKDELRPWIYDTSDGILSKTGGNAMGSSGQMAAITDDIRRRYSEQITDPEVRDAFLKRWSSEEENAKDLAARHELGQISEYKAETTKATLSQGLLDAYTGYNDPKSLELAKRNVLSAIRANTLGLPPEAVRVEEAKAVSQLHLAVIARWAETDPNKALDYQAEHADEIVGPDSVNAMKLIQPALQMRQADEFIARGMTRENAAGNALWASVEAAESGGDPTAVSPAGALGVAQLMPDTAREIARSLGEAEIAGLSDSALKAFLTDPKNAEINRSFGKAYLTWQLKAFGGDTEAALVAYNAGPEGARDFLRHNTRLGRGPGQRDYNVPDRPKIKSETEGYVQKVLSGVGSGPASGRMTAENWTLQNIEPWQIIAPTEGGAWVDARAATQLDTLVGRMKEQFPGFSLKVNEKPQPGVTAGRRRGTSDPRDNPHVKNSQHLHGTAFDIQMVHADGKPWSPVERGAFLSLARQLGFGGVGFYGEAGHLHIDMGTPRTWGGMPNWARSAMQVPVGEVPGRPSSIGFLGTGGTGSTPNGPGAFYVDPLLADFQRLQMEAMAIPDSSVRALALQKLTIAEAAQTQAVKAREGEVKQSAWNTVLAGSVNDLSPSQLAQLEPSFISSLYAYQANRDSGKLTDDWAAITQFRQLSNQQMVDMGVEIYDRYRPITTDARFNELLDLQAAARRALESDQASIDLLAGTRTRSQILSDAHSALGWTPAKHGEKINNFSRLVDERIRMEQAATGKELGLDQVQDIIDKLLIEDKAPGWFNRSEGQAFRITPDKAAEFTAVTDWSEVPSDDQATLVDQFRLYNGADPTAEKAADLYNRAMQVWLGAEPSIPEDDEAWMQERSMQTFGRPSTEQELKGDYGRYLRALLGYRSAIR